MNTGIEENVKEKIVSLISALIPKAKIYVYGSRARGQYRQWSDIDIALDVGQEISRFLVAEVKNVIESTDIPYKIDVVDIHSVSDSMRDSILKDKIVWKN